MSILYGSPHDFARMTLDEIPVDSITEKIQRLALIRKDELQTILEYPRCPDRAALEKELEIIGKILDIIDEIVPDRSAC